MVEGGAGAKRRGGTAEQASSAQLPYPVFVRHGILAEAGALTAEVAAAHGYALISDHNVAPLYGQKLLGSFGGSRAELFTMSAGEPGKTVESWRQLSEQMLAARFGRDTTIVALGGGIVGDVAGFVAATYMRGVPYVQVPTTVVAMVDSSIGGKTGVNSSAGKNLIGAFHPPRAVIMDPSVLTTLPIRELRAGLAEVLKHGMIADAEYLTFVDAILPEILESAGQVESMTDVILKSVEIKARIVAMDEREGGIRKILNFGHTIGHALESLSSYTLLHGEAIAIGMCVEARAAEIAGIAESGLSKRVSESFRRAGLPVELPASIAAEDVLQAASSDKKVRAGELELAVPSRIGRMAGEDSGWALRIPREILMQAMQH